jgi:hypothetical protein
MGAEYIGGWYEAEYAPLCVDGEIVRVSDGDAWLDDDDGQQRNHCQMNQMNQKMKNPNRKMMKNQLRA